MKWMVEFDVESHIVINPDEKRPLVFNDPLGRFHIEVDNKAISPGIELPLLRMCVVFNTENKIVETGEKYLLEFLDVSSLSVASKLVPNRVVRFMDWEPGKTERSFTQFIENSNPDMPMFGLDSRIISTVEEMMKFDHDLKFRKSVRWFRRGVNADYVEDQFQNFWFAIEVLAQRNKSNNKVPDKCQKCKEPLYCRSCEEVSMHKPFAKQAVETLIRAHGHGTNIDVFIKDCFDARNSLLHGEFSEEIDKKLSQSMQQTTDKLGKVARAAILSSVKLIGDGTKKQLSFLEPNTFAHFRVTTEAHGSLSSANADPDNPSPDDYVGGMLELKVTESPK